MDEIDRVIEGMERELEEQEAETSALGDRLSAGQSSVRADLNAAIRRGGQLRSDIFDLKRAYDRFTPLERARRHFPCGCGTPSGPPRPREEILASRREIAQLEMGAMGLSALTDEAVHLLASAWDHPRGELESLADFCAATPAYSHNVDPAGRRSAAHWRAAMQILEDTGLAERTGARLECYDLTWIGFRVAGMIHRGGWPPKE
jgi:hypothetical protein